MLIALLSTTACGFLTIPQSAGETDQSAIVEEVLATVQAELAEQPAPVQVVYQEAALADSSLEATLTNLYEMANPAVVYIIVQSVGSGSGFVYSADGYIVTNNHVVHGGRSYEIVFSNGERAYADLVGADFDSDLAVLKVESLPDGIEPLALADPDSVVVGQFVAAIGNPFGEQGSMTLGIISGLSRSLPSQRELESGSTYSLPNVIQTDAPINPGNSGGPLLNLSGEVVGINSAIASTTGTSSGVGFAIPVEAINRIVPSLIENGEYIYPYMGAGFDDEVSLGDMEVYGLTQTQGAYVASVIPGGPADQAGLIGADPSTLKGGDLVIQIDDEVINNFADLNSYLVFHTTPGQVIQVTVLRGAQRLTLPLTLGERP
jgi:2-alkenal reductase